MNKGMSSKELQFIRIQDLLVALIFYSLDTIHYSKVQARGYLDALKAVKLASNLPVNFKIS